MVPNRRGENGAIPDAELRQMDGSEIVAAILAIFNEVAAAMNLVMSQPFLAVGSRALQDKRL